MSMSSREASASWMFRGCGEWLVVVGAAGGLGVGRSAGGVGRRGGV